MMNKVNIPERYVSESFDTYKPTNPKAKANVDMCRQYVETWLDRKSSGEGIVFSGTPGTGKTHLAMSIAKRISEQYNDDVFITTVSRIIRAYRRTWSDNSGISDLDVLAKYCEPDLLIIDEIGVQYGTDSERNILLEIINDRYEDLLPTILISNLPLDEMANILGERTIDRVLHHGAVLAFNWESYMMAQLTHVAKESIDIELMMSSVLACNEQAEEWIKTALEQKNE